MYEDCELYELELKDGNVLHIAHISANAKGSFNAELKYLRRTESEDRGKKNFGPTESRFAEESAAAQNIPDHIYIVEESRRYSEGVEIEKDWVGAYVTLNDANNMAIRVGKACEQKYGLEPGGVNWHKDFKEGCISLECEIKDGKEIQQILVAKLLLNSAGSVPKLPKTRKRSRTEAHTLSDL